MIYTFTKTINTPKLHREIDDANFQSATFQSITAHGDDVSILFDNALDSGDESSLNDLVSAHNPVDTYSIVNAKRIKAINGFNDLVGQFVTENILMGITQAGKTVLIQNTLQSVLNFGMTGSLYAAKDEMNAITITAEMDPFLTETRRSNFIAKLDALIASL